MHLISEYDKYQ